jgi:hypothetical protein
LKKNPPIKDLDDLKKWVESATKGNRTETITKRNVPKIGDDSKQFSNLTLLINNYTDNKGNVNIQKLDYLINTKFKNLNVFQLNKKLIELSRYFQRISPQVFKIKQNKLISEIPEEFRTQDNQLFTDEEKILDYVNQFFPMNPKK